MKTNTITPITYPARPISVGTEFKQLGEAWGYEPKYNGWRALVHIPSRTMFNRKGEQLTIAKEFDEALELLCPTLDAQAFKWADCEALDRRHGIGKGTLIVLDVVPEPLYAGASYTTRRQWFMGTLRPLHPDCKPEPNEVYQSACISSLYAEQAWTQLQDLNTYWGCDFYEGLVAKRLNSPYNIQLNSPDQTTSSWCKMRWPW